MKANAPEKLYIALNELTEDGRTFVLDHLVDYPICTEYTRTDAFIEKACEWLHTMMQTHAVVELLSGEHYEKELIKDFRKYMRR